ncbi:MAG: DNA-3-methyladenine glycosylase [Bacteroidota bacterium]
MHKLPSSFYTRRTLTVAKDLLGKIFVHNIGKKILSGKIVEVEAYLHNDPACHAFRGMTERNKVMFNEGGYVYVYFTYGVHYCANIVTYKKGVGEAVLIRAVEPITGIEVMKKNRHTDVKHLYNLTNGPAKFTQAFGLGREHNGISLLGNEIFLLRGEQIPPSKIIATTRIGITAGREKKWRFYIKDNPWISKS